MAVGIASLLSWLVGTLAGFLIAVTLLRAIWRRSGSLVCLSCYSTQPATARQLETLENKWNRLPAKWKEANYYAVPSAACRRCGFSTAFVPSALSRAPISTTIPTETGSSGNRTELCH